MTLDIKGFVLEPTRLGRSNAPTTFSPNVVISNSGDFTTAYPSNENANEVEYHWFVLEGGPIHEAKFAWTKNETVSRFGYSGLLQRFRTLPGGPPQTVGLITPDANTTDRLVVTGLVSIDTAQFPIRLVVAGSIVLTATVVASPGNFTVPAVGNVQIALSTGEVHWNAANIATYEGEAVTFQSQSFGKLDAELTPLGLATDADLHMSPRPATGQFPLIRVSTGLYLQPVERANDGLLSVNPTVGTVEWSLTTGRIKVNSSYGAESVYYDGVALGFALQAPITTQGTVNTPTAIGAILDTSVDIYFRTAAGHQFPEVAYVDSFSTFGSVGVVEVIPGSGSVQLSLPDRIAHGAQALQLVRPVITIERGLSIVLSRTPSDPGNTDPSVSDVSAVYSVTDALLASPIVAAPSVVLPVVPIKGSTFQVLIDGPGRFNGYLQDLGASPTPGIGFVIDYPKATVSYAQYREDRVLRPAPLTPFGAVQLDPLLFSPNLVVEQETFAGSNIFTALQENVDFTIDLSTGLVELITSPGIRRADGVGATVIGDQFTDNEAQFSTETQAGDYLVLEGSALHTVEVVGSNSVLTVAENFASVDTSAPYSVHRDPEVVADRSFKDVPVLDPTFKVDRIRSLGAASNSPRLTLPTEIPLLGARIRLGVNTFVTLTQVANDGMFNPSLPTGTVEVSTASRNLNFSGVDVGSIVYSCTPQILGRDFRLQAGLGFLDFMQPFAERDEVVATYTNSSSVLVNETCVFEVRKEACRVSTPSATVGFNPIGRRVAATPTPSVYRGGRPQRKGITVDTVTSTIEFAALPNQSDVLPNGNLSPSETVYVDYFVYEALGGEKSLTLQSPVQIAAVTVEAGATSFTLPGDMTAQVRANRLLAIGDEVYHVGTVAFTSGSTLVSLTAGQTFRTSQTNPLLRTTTGSTRLTGVGILSSYFTLETTPYTTSPRNATTLTFQGDLTATLGTQTILYWESAGLKEFSVIEGSTFDAETSSTKVTLKAATRRQYTPLTATLRRSVRPVLSGSTPIAQLKTAPKEVLFLARKVEGAVGAVLESGTDYTLDSSGRATLSTALTDSESLLAFYVGHRVIADGRALRASYLSAIAPTDLNGLLGQTAYGTYSTYMPDTAYWRVMKLSTLKNELLAKFASEAASTGGPRLSNTAQPTLKDQGQESVFFSEGRLTNEDLVARPVLLHYHAGVEAIEDALAAEDGRRVGSADGRFKYNGLLTNPPSLPGSELNQIDDSLKVTQAPFSITYPPFVATSIGTYQEAYKRSKTSRFYPTYRTAFGVAGSATETGEAILDLKTKPIAGVESVNRRLPWATVTQRALSGATTLQVDTTDGSLTLLRPGFDLAFNHRVCIVSPSGTLLVADGPGILVTGKTLTSLTLTSGVPVDIPVGSTIRHVSTYEPSAAPASPYLKSYKVGLDVGFSREDGTLTYVKPLPPLDGSFPGIPAPLLMVPPAPGEVLDVVFQTAGNTQDPDRFPALNGRALTDDLDRGFPAGPSPDAEGGLCGGLTREQDLIETGGRIRSITTAPFVGTGSLDATRRVITNSGGAWPLPAPKLGDIVQIRTGLNAFEDYRLIELVGVDTILVTSGNEFPSVDTGFQFAVSVATPLTTSTLGQLLATNSLTDAIATFTSNIKPGHTVVITTGPNAYLRRQVVRVISDTALEVEPFPATDASVDYYIDNSLLSYGGVPGSLLDGDLLPAMDAQLVALGALDTKLQQAFDHFTTSVHTGVTGSVTIGLATFNTITPSFSASDVGRIIYISTGANFGVYRVVSYQSTTQVTVDVTFPATEAGLNYSVRDSTLSLTGLRDILRFKAEAALAVINATAFEVLATMVEAVAGDASAFANRLLISDFTAREAQVAARISQINDAVTGTLAGLEVVLLSSDRLYDKRYTWIDSRINLTDGILPKRDRAKAQRLKAKDTLLKQVNKASSLVG